jgi:uncharacterized protein (DUF1501 family)
MPSLSLEPHQPFSPPTTRRNFIAWSGKTLGLVALGRIASGPLATAVHAAGLPPPDRRILVLVQLVGGNDGLNTVIPFEDDNYYRLRPTLAIAKSRVLPISDLLGLHPACRALHSLFDSGNMTVVQNVGYPQPSRSHFRSAEIWAAGGRNPEFETSGWLGRYLDLVTPGLRDDSAPAATYLTEALPPCLRQSSATTISLRRPRPGDGFAASLQCIAAHIASDRPTQVYVLSLGDFDTHGNQANTHEYLLTTLANGLKSFQLELVRRGLERQVLTMTVSEFGRRAAENECRGTDHGTAAPLFLMGPDLQGALAGTPPVLDLSRQQDLAHTTDFRQVYATVLADWLGCTAAAVLGSPVEKLALFKSGPAPAKA